MEPKIRIEIAKNDITKAFDLLPKRVLVRRELRKIVEQNREFWRLGNTTPDAFLNIMLQVSPLKKIRLPFPNRIKVVYTWRDVGLFQLLQSLDTSGYFCHYTALHFHGLTEQIPKTIYLNVEQPGTGGGGQLTQEAIDRTFKGKCRVSNNFVEYEGFRVYILNGANTGQLGIIEIESPESDQHLWITDIERTLIDATVRPVYSGGISEVAKAYELAKDQVSVNKLAAYLRKLNYTYPYHQVIGYYLERAGYRPSQLDLLEQFEMEFDFYITYGIKDKDYIKRWRLFVPKNF